MTDSDATSGAALRSPLRRRDLLRLGLLGGTGLAGAALLGACGPAAPPVPAKTETKPAEPAKPAEASKPGPAEQGASAKPAGGVSGELRFLSEDTSEVEVNWYRDANAAFMKAYPGVTISSEHVSTATDFFPKLQTQLAAKSPPDFVPQSNYSRVITLWSQGVLEPVNDIIEKLGPSDFKPEILDRVKVGDNYIGIPLQASCLVLWYRTDLAQEAGAKPPTNWNEFLAFAKALNKDGIAGVIYAFGRNAAGNRIFFDLLRTNGGNLVDPDLNVVFDSPATYETLEFVKELAQYSPPGSANYAYAELINPFVSGKAASTFYPGRPLQAVNAQNPALADKIAPIALPYNKEPFTDGDPAVTYIFKDAKRKDLAKLWITDIQYGPEWHVKWVNILPGHNLPVRESIKQSAEYRNNELLKKYPEIVKVLQEQADRAGSFSKESPAHKINTQGGVISSGPILAEVVQRVLVNNEPPKAAAAWGHKELVDIMKDAVKL